MEIKTQQPVRVMYGNVTATLNTLKTDVGNVPEDLYTEAGKAGLQPAGPQHWVYIGADENRDTQFSLDMGLPVQGDGTSDKYQVKELPALKCATTIHEGSWDNFAATYEKLIGEVMAKGLKMTNECREVYLNVDMENPEKNITEVQVGIE